MAVIAIDLGSFFDHVIDVIAGVARMLFCGSRLIVLKKMYKDSGRFVFTVFCCSRIESCVEICTDLQENRLKC